MGAAAVAYGNRDICSAFVISQDVGVGIFAWMFGPYHILMPGAQVNGDHHGVDFFKPQDLAMHYIKHHEEDRCDGKKDNGWSHADRYDQDMVIGCGKMEKSVVNHDKNKRADMYDAWHYYRLHGKDVVLDRPGENEFIEALVVTDREGKMQRLVKERVELAKNEDGSYVVPAEGVTLIDESVYKLAEGEKVERHVIPRLMPLRGYSGTQHAKDNDVTKVWKPFTLNDCSPPGKKQH
jgi:hypothetical protein